MLNNELRQQMYIVHNNTLLLFGTVYALLARPKIRPGKHSIYIHGSNFKLMPTLGGAGTKCHLNSEIFQIDA